MKISRAALRPLALFGLICGAFQGQSAAQNAPAAPVSPSLEFMVLGDWGTGVPQQKAVAEAMARHADGARASNPVRFTLLTGDNFYEKGVNGVDDPQWQQKFEQMYDPKRLDMPFMAVLGNHDWGLDPLAQILYASKNPGTRWQMDGFWYQRQVFLPGADGQWNAGTGAPLADIFFVDTDLWSFGLKRLADKQLNWLTSGLKNSQARWQIVVGHHPLYSNGGHGRDADMAKMRELLDPLFKHAGVDAYFAGHDHDLQHITRPDLPTTFIVSGAGGKLRNKRFNDYPGFHASSPGFAAVTLSADEMKGRFLDDKGASLHEWRITPVAALPGEWPAPAAPVAAPNAAAKEED